MLLDGMAVAVVRRSEAWTPRFLRTDTQAYPYLNTYTSSLLAIDRVLAFRSGKVRRSGSSRLLRVGRPQRSEKEAVKAVADYEWGA